MGAPDGGARKDVLHTRIGRHERHRRWWWAAACLAVCLCLSTGCLSRAVSSGNADLSQVLPQEEHPARLVGDVTRPVGTNFVKVEAVVLVTQLEDTGSDPPPSALRDRLMSDMKARGVRNPNQVLASPKTALALASVWLPPGVQQGDRVDVLVRTPPRSGAKSLRAGWLMEANLTEIAVMGGQAHDGHDRAVAGGQILVEAAIDGDEDPVLLTRGRIPGGARSLMARSLGLVVREGYKSVRISSRIGTAINTRFHTFDEAGIKQGVSTPKRDDFIELRIHPRYRSNIARYIQVIRSISFAEAPTERIDRLTQLQGELLRPETSAMAALKLEALGEEARGALANGLDSEDVRVRFYAAEALAYLDDERAIPELAAAAEKEPAFRWHALTALSGMDDLSVFDELEKLLHVVSAETRYGAFRALQARGPTAPAVKGEQMRGGFAFHAIDTSGEPMVHLSRVRRPELVLFGRDHRFQTPFVLFLGKDFIVKGQGGDSVRVSRFLQEDTATEVCSARVEDVIRAVDKLGGSYSHVIQLLREARSKRALTCRVVLDAGPRPGRKYSGDGNGPTGETGVAAAETPLPDLFFVSDEGEGDGAESGGQSSPEDLQTTDSGDDKAQSGGGFFGRMGDWLTP